MGDGTEVDDGSNPSLSLHHLAKSLGTEEVALRYIVALFICLSLAILYKVLEKASPAAKNIYFFACGTFINYFCFGEDSIHAIITIVLSYMSIVAFGGTLWHVIFSFVFQMSYLFTGYIMVATDSYDVKWTTPQCILCLRLIGLAWDIYDGKRIKEHLSPDQQKTSIDRLPTFLEVLGYSYFFGGFLVGPQFSFQRYVKFLDNTLIEEGCEEKGPSRYIAGLIRLLIGIGALLLYMNLDSKYRTDHMLQDAFLNQSFPMKVVHNSQIYIVQYAKYLIAWQIADCTCILTGIAYSGVTKEGNAKWDGLKNFSMKLFFFGRKFQSMVEGFNVNTNIWVGRYVFKRLRFLGNKNLSHISTLMFLALWHGFYVGYFITFALEFLVIITERQFHDFCYDVTGTKFDDLPSQLRIPLHALQAIFKCFGCAFCSVPFLMLRWSRTKVIWGAMYYWLVIVCVIWLVSEPLLRICFVKKKETSGEEKKDN